MEPVSLASDAESELAPPSLRRGKALEMFCSKCTRVGYFFGTDHAEAAAQAKDAGWVMERGRFVCKRCPAVR